MFGFENFTQKQIIVSIATLLGAFGGFPEAPKLFNKIAKFEICKIQIIRWFLVFALVYQGGSGQNIKLALLITISALIIYILLQKYEKKTNKNNLISQ